MKKKKIVLSVIYSLICLLFTGLSLSFAWFIGLSQRNIEQEFVTLGNIKAKLYYLNDNYDEENNKFKGYNSLDSFTMPTLPSDYNDSAEISNFTLVNLENQKNVFKMEELLPNTKFSFLIQFKGEYSSSYDFSLTIESFISGNLTTEKEIPTTSTPVEQIVSKLDDKGREINFAEAINIYVSEPYTASNAKDNLQTFLTSNSNTDYFDYSSENIFDKKNLMYRSGLTANETYYVAFTFEFSSSSDTFYSYDSENECYVKDVNGTSNVYQNMYFKIMQLTIKDSTYQGAKL
ncbi:MAG: hypothetical protein ACI31G_00015 [Bacilli bacterium]